MFCPECGTENPPNAKFCYECGIRISEATERSEKIPENSGNQVEHLRSDSVDQPAKRNLRI